MKLQNTSQSRKNGESAYALIVLLILIAVSGTLFSVFIRVAFETRRNSFRAYQAAKAFNLAEAGIEVALTELSQEEPRDNIKFTLAEGEVSVSIKAAASDHTQRVVKAIITSVGAYPAKSDRKAQSTCRVLAKQASSGTWEIINWHSSRPRFTTSNSYTD